MPNYFSGTNCRASGVVIPPAGWSIAYMELDVGGETTDSLVDLSGEPTPPMGRSLNVMFDSTHFTPLDDITVSIYAIVYDPNSSAWDEYFVESDGVPVLNRSVIYGRYDFEDQPVTWADIDYWFGNSDWSSCPVVKTKLESMNYSTQAYNHTERWDFDSLSADIPYGNVFYVSTHGYTDNFSTDYNDFYYQYTQNYYPPALTWHNVKAYSGFYQLGPVLVNSVGIGLPPYNTGNPPINLAFVNACDTGQSEDLAAAFLYPWCNIYSPYDIEDQCELGYNGPVYIEQTRNQADYVLTKMLQGCTAETARSYAETKYYEDTETDQPANTQFFALHGDELTKIVGVYGTDDYVTDWWAQLQ